MDLRLTHFFALATIVTSFVSRDWRLLEGAARIYANNFTIDEMVQFENFYRLPVGQTLLQTSQEITRRRSARMSVASAEELKLRLTEALRRKGHRGCGQVVPWHQDRHRRPPQADARLLHCRTGWTVRSFSALRHVSDADS
jgi:hypothetical protein